LRSHDFYKNQIGFNPTEYENMRYGVNISAARIEAKKASAVRMLQREIRRWLIRKRIKSELRRPGYKY